MSIDEKALREICEEQKHFSELLEGKLARACLALLDERRDVWIPLLEKTQAMLNVFRVECTMDYALKKRNECAETVDKAWIVVGSKS